MAPPPSAAPAPPPDATVRAEKLITIKPERSVDQAVREITLTEKPQGEPVAILIKPERADGTSVREQAQRIENKVEKPPRTSSIDEERCYVKNSSFLSKDIQARKAQAEANTKAKEGSPPKKNISPPIRSSSTPPKKEILSPPSVASPPKAQVTFSPKKIFSPPKEDVVSPPSIEAPDPPKKITSPPMSVFKAVSAEVKTNNDNCNSNTMNKDLTKYLIKTEKETDDAKLNDSNEGNANPAKEQSESDETENNKQESNNGVGDKIKKFEKAAEDANTGKLSRLGSIRRKSHTERLGSDSKEDLPPPATPFKDTVQFELNAHTDKTGSTHDIDTHQVKNNQNSMALKWQRTLENPTEEKIKKPEPQKIIKPEFKPMSSPVDVTIRSPSLGAKVSDQFPSHCTAFRNVASPDIHRFNDDVNTQNNFKTCKLKKEKYSVSKGSSYFTRGSEEIWLVKKKDIEEIEERVLDSFRRAGGNVCMRSESMRPSSDSGQAASFTHATMGRTKRQMYARSESLDPQWANARAQTLKRQSSVACTCGHDKKTRVRNVASDVTSRPRSRSHGDENNQAQGHVLDKYETLV